MTTDNTYWVRTRIRGYDEKGKVLWYWRKASSEEQKLADRQQIPVHMLYPNGGA